MEAVGLIWRRYRDSNYEVSTLGEVRNIKTRKILRQHKKYNGKLENDYMKISLTIDGKRIKKSVHRIVAECFLENYSEELEVNHKNSIRYDNKLSNLEMCTRKYNHDYSIDNGFGTKRRPVYAVDKEGNTIYFNGLWAAAQFINIKRETNYKIEHICNSIRNSLNNNNRTAYGYRWYENKDIDKSW